MANKIDLHTHSVCSDGTLTPKELAREAARAGLCAAALTDHDTTEGIPEFSAECERIGIEPVPGIEIGTKYKRELHIVGLYAGGDEFDSVVSRLKNGRGERNRKMIKMLRDAGFDITENDITTHNDIESAGRVHIANALLEKGYVKTRDEAFEKYIAKGRPYYAERFSLTPEESVRFIKRCGGTAVWAHPAQAADTEAEMTEIALRLKAAGLDAMECLYSRYTDAETEMCMRTAKNAGLLMSGGSDFHGANKPDVKLGVVNGGYVPYEFLLKIKEKCNGAVS